MSESKIKRALSVSNITSMKYEVYPFSGKWREMLNQPEHSGVWFIWGNSGSGKSSFIMQLAKELAKYEKVLYNSLEEFGAMTFKERIERFRMNEVSSNFQAGKYTLDEMIKIIKRQRSPQVIIIDSEKYLKWNFDKYMQFKEMCLRLGKTIIIIGRARGKRVSGQLAEDIMFDAYIKIFVEGYKAFSKGREIGSNGGIYTIWKEGADRYWGDAA